MDPEWKKLKAQFPNMVFDIDCTAEEDLCKKLQVGGYPTIKLFSKGREIAYSGARTHDKLARWLVETIRNPPPALPIKPKQTEPKFMQGKKKAFVRFGAPWCGHSRAMNPAWEKLKKDLPGKVMDVDCTAERELCDEQKIRGFPTLKLYNNGSVSEYTGDRSYEHMLKWFHEN